jgi:hypothetical protein
MRLTPGEYERAVTWNVTIAGILLGDGFTDGGADRHWPGHGGFYLCRATDAWYSFAAGRGHYSSAEMVRLLNGCPSGRDKSTRALRRAGSLGISVESADRSISLLQNYSNKKIDQSAPRHRGDTGNRGE